MGDLESRFFGDLAGRLSGPYMFRFFLQPLMGLIYAFRDGLKDAKAGRPPYFWALFYDPAERRHLVREGWHATVRVMLLGAFMDGLYEFTVFRSLRLVELLVVVLVLAVAPYVLLRGPINRIAARFLQRRTTAPRPEA
jgi:hypothetical protein